MQRVVRASAPAPSAPPAPPPPTPVPVQTAPAAPPPGAPHPVTPDAEPPPPPQAELDALARRLVAPLSRLLRAELRGDRERLGRLRDR
ncbi:hypothetical protein [Streptomyces sp. NPDC058701]|uniref:hypothetical protein n=1 Tax=Streptomyces sp. NPDC058701 TaxID=3346608 RepID=UPI003659949E